MEKVLVTGTTGYIGLHCVAQLLEAGYYVRGSMRSKEREPEVRNALAKVVNAENRFEMIFILLSCSKSSQLGTNFLDIKVETDLITFWKKLSMYAFLF